MRTRLGQRAGVLVVLMAGLWALGTGGAWAGACPAARQPAKLTVAAMLPTPPEDHTTPYAELTKEMDRLGVVLTEPPKRLKIGLQTVERTPAEQRAFETKVGPATVEAGLRMMASPEYQQYAGKPHFQAIMLRAALLPARKMAAGEERLRDFRANPSAYTTPP